MFLYLRLSEAFNAAGGTHTSAFLLETQHMAERWSSVPSSINSQSLGNSLVWQTISLRGLQAADFWGCHKLRDNPILFLASGDSYQESEFLHTVNIPSSSVSNTLNASHRNIFQATDPTQVVSAPAPKKYSHITKSIELISLDHSVTANTHVNYHFKVICFMITWRSKINHLEVLQSRFHFLPDIKCGFQGIMSHGLSPSSSSVYSYQAFLPLLTQPH